MFLRVIIRPRRSGLRINVILRWWIAVISLVSTIPANEHRRNYSGLMSSGRSHSFAWQWNKLWVIMHLLCDELPPPTYLLLLLLLLLFLLLLLLRFMCLLLQFTWPPNPTPLHHYPRGSGFICLTNPLVLLLGQCTSSHLRIGMYNDINE